MKISQFRGRSNRYIDCLFIRYVHKYRYSSGRGAREVGGSLFIRYVHKYRYSSVRGAREVGGSRKVPAASALRRSRNRLARSAPDIGVPVCGPL
ncbi:hypothetical protein TNCV_918421 [Trichonephila clavipes]|nr:hypothetical protein TNCV_918421 [Trichonephila clavipes]